VYHTMVHHTSVAIAAIVCISNAIGWAMRFERHQVSAATSTDEKSKIARLVASAAAAETSGEARRRTDLLRRKDVKKIKKVVLSAELKKKQRMAQKKPTEQQQLAHKEYKREAYAERRREQLMRMTLKDLQDRCRRASLPDVGIKAVLVEALMAKKNALQAKKRMRKEGVGKSDDAGEFFLHDVASSNMTEHQVASSGDEAGDVLGDEANDLLEDEAGGLFGDEAGGLLIATEWLEQVDEIEDVFQLMLDREATQLRPRQYREVKQLEVMEGQEKAEQLQDQVELLLQH